MSGGGAMTPWYILILVAFLGAIATQWLNRYFVISSGKYSSANDLIKNLESVVTWTASFDPSQPKESEYHGVNQDINDQLFFKFVSYCWPHQQLSLIKMINEYRTIVGAFNKHEPTKEILNKVKKYSKIS